MRIDLHDDGDDDFVIAPMQTFHHRKSVHCSFSFGVEFVLARAERGAYVPNAFGSKWDRI